MPDTAIPVLAETPILTQADGFTLCYFAQRSSRDASGDYKYEHHTTLNAALDAYREYEDGEYRLCHPVGIFAVKDGLPIGGRMDPAQVMRLMKETRAA